MVTVIIDIQEFPRVLLREVGQEHLRLFIPGMVLMAMGMLAKGVHMLMVVGVVAY